MEKWGALHFLCVSEKIGGRRYSRFLKYQTPILQSLVAPALPRAAFQSDGVAASFLARSSIEPGLSICPKLHELDIEPRRFGLNATELPSQVQNTLRELGIIASTGGPVDPIAEILERRYGLAGNKSWQALLGSDYVHALGLLKQAEAAFGSGMSFWLACQNSFNHAIFIAVQRHLNATGHPGTCTVVGRNGQLVDFGVMLDPSGPFARQCPDVANCFRDMNTRRNHLPVSHPYEKKTRLQTRHLKAQERNKFVARLRTAYPDFEGLMP